MIYDKDCENDPNIKYKINISKYYYSVLRIIMLELKRLRVILLKKNKTKPKYFDHHHFFLVLIHVDTWFCLYQWCLKNLNRQGSSVPRYFRTRRRENVLIWVNNTFLRKSFYGQVWTNVLFMFDIVATLAFYMCDKNGGHLYMVLDDTIPSIWFVVFPERNILINICFSYKST